MKKFIIIAAIGLALFFIIQNANNELQKIKNNNTNNQETLKGIILIDGQLGKYGKYVTADGEQYIYYYIPDGIYTVTWLDSSTARVGTLFVEKNATTINSDGYTENEVVMKVSINLDKEYYPSNEITISGDEHIFITINSSFQLIKN